MIKVHTKESLPTLVVKTLFLAGPTLRQPTTEVSWRTEALQILQELGFDGHVFTPEYRDGADIDVQTDEGYSEQCEWEEKALNQADIVVFWVPRDLKKLPAFTTNIEFGAWCESGKVVFGYPKDCPNPEKNRYLEHYARKYNVPVAYSLKETLQNALSKIGEGALRRNGEAKVPLYIYNHPTFQSWLESQRKNGNELVDAKVLWNFRPKHSDFVFCFALHVDVFIEAENRHKVNEFILARTDISSIVMFYHPEETLATIEELLDTKVVFVKEFRSPARTQDSFITEIPGGSASKKLPPAMVIVHELEEETSFKLDASRLVEIGSRQLAGTFSAHNSHLFGTRITREEYKYFRNLANSGMTFGVQGESEMTYVVVMDVREMLASKRVDWSNIGMIFQALMSLKKPD